MSSPKEILAAFCKTKDADLLVYKGGINRIGVESIQKALEEESKQHDRLIFSLTTFGGDPHASYKIIRALKRQYDKVTLFVTSYCKSAGTLVSIGCDDIVICDRGELGPLDVQMKKPGELFEQSSGLEMVEALAFLQGQVLGTFRECLIDINARGGIPTQMASEMATKLSIGLFSPIYQQMNPLAIGERQRAISIAYEYGKRLDAGNLKEDALEKLVGGYPSHGFVIDREESETIFKKVRAPESMELQIARMVALIPTGPGDGDPFVVFENGVQDEQSTEGSDSASTPRVEQSVGGEVQSGGSSLDGDGEGNSNDSDGGATDSPEPLCVPTKEGIE